MFESEYDARVNAEHFRVYISEHNNGLFNATCLYYDLHGGRLLGTADQPGRATIKSETKVANDEAAALKDISDWIENKFESPVKLELVL